MNFYQKLIRKIGILTGLSFVGTYQKKWWNDGGDDALRYNHDGLLNKESIVFDLGGYLGEFADKIHRKYDSKVYVFEIVPNCIAKMEKLFENKTDKVIICSFGLSEFDVDLAFQGSGPGAKLAVSTSGENAAHLKAIGKFLEERQIDNVDLMKINIEGAEYDLLNYLCKSGLIKKFRKIQVQFHDFDADCLEKLLAINRNLSETHKNIFCYPFVWEEWERKN